MRTWYVYLYPYPQGMTIDGVDVSGIIFYVGKGTGGRFDAHEREAEKGCSCKKCCAIRRCWDAGFVIQKQLVFQTPKEQEAFDKERELIHQHREPCLTNVAHNQAKPVQRSKKRHYMGFYTDSGKAITLDVTDFVPKGVKYKDLSLNEKSELLAKAKVRAGYETEPKIPVFAAFFERCLYKGNNRILSPAFYRQK